MGSYNEVLYILYGILSLYIGYLIINSIRAIWLWINIKIYLKKILSLHRKRNEIILKKSSDKYLTDPIRKNDKYFKIANNVEIELFMISSQELMNISLDASNQIQKLDKEIKFYQVEYNHINSKLHNISEIVPLNFVWKLGKLENHPFFGKNKRLNTKLDIKDMWFYKNGR